MKECGKFLWDHIVTTGKLKHLWGIFTLQGSVSRLDQQIRIADRGKEKKKVRIHMHYRIILMQNIVMHAHGNVNTLKMY